VASAPAFLLSELADFAVYTPLQARGLVLAVLASSVVGLIVDSVLFLWLAFGSLEFHEGQILGKLWMVLLSLPFIQWIRRREIAGRVAVEQSNARRLGPHRRSRRHLRPASAAGHARDRRDGLRRRGQQPSRRRSFVRPAAYRRPQAGGRSRRPGLPRSPLLGPACDGRASPRFCRLAR